MIRKFKSGNLKKKFLLIDNHEVQFGVRTELIFDYMTSKNHLLFSLFIGNKSQNPIKNIKVDYFGDHSNNVIIHILFNYYYDNYINNYFLACELWKK